jgi:hypothetical protein
MKSPKQHIFVISLFVGLSCKDQGDVVNHVQLLEVIPSPNATDVDKATAIQVRFDRAINWNEAAKIRLRYVDDTSRVNSYAGCGLTPPNTEVFCVGPFIWKPGRIVEVTIPKEIADPEGNTLQQSFTYRFTTALDTIPFDVVETRPAQNDSVSIGTFNDLFGMLRFSDYVHVGDSTLSIDPPATVVVNTVITIDGRNCPQRLVYFRVSGLQPFLAYTLTIPARIADYEGQTLPGDRHLAFHTIP